MKIWDRIFKGGEKVEVSITVNETPAESAAPAMDRFMQTVTSSVRDAARAAERQKQIDEKKEREEELNKAINDAVTEVENGLLQTAFARDTRHQTEHARDVADYHFGCHRYADFLSVQITRMGESYVGAINLRGSKAIHFVPGHGPDREGQVSYMAQVYRDFEGNYYPRGHKPRIYESFLDSTDRAMFCADPAPQVAQPRYFACRPVGRVTAGYPRPALNDEIVFEGVGRLLCPAGMGQHVYAAVLTQIATAPAYAPPVAEDAPVVPQPGNAC